MDLSPEAAEILRHNSELEQIIAGLTDNMGEMLKYHAGVVERVNIRNGHATNRALTARQLIGKPAATGAAIGFAGERFTLTKWGWGVLYAQGYINNAEFNGALARLAEADEYARLAALSVEAAQADVYADELYAGVAEPEAAPLSKPDAYALLAKLSAEFADIKAQAPTVAMLAEFWHNVVAPLRKLIRREDYPDELTYERAQAAHMAANSEALEVFSQMAVMVPDAPGFVSLLAGDSQHYYRLEAREWTRIADATARRLADAEKRRAVAPAEAQMVCGNYAPHEPHEYLGHPCRGVKASGSGWLNAQQTFGERLPDVSTRDVERAAETLALDDDEIHRIKIVARGDGRFAWLCVTMLCQHPGEGNFRSEADAAEAAGAHGVVVASGTPWESSAPAEFGTEPTTAYTPGLPPQAPEAPYPPRLAPGQRDELPAQATGKNRLDMEWSSRALGDSRDV